MKKVMSILALMICFNHTCNAAPRDDLPSERVKECYGILRLCERESIDCWSSADLELQLCNERVHRRYLECIIIANSRKNDDVTKAACQKNQSEGTRGCKKAFDEKEKECGKALKICKKDYYNK